MLLDARTLPKLTMLELGEKDPANRVLDLAAKSGQILNEFPERALRFLPNLESIILAGQNISCFPNTSKLLGLSSLRMLDMSDTNISYVPPSLVLKGSGIALKLFGTPISSYLDWSHHSLGLEFSWDRIAKSLPSLRGLDLSNTGIQDAKAIHLEDLSALEYLDVSNNPLLTPLDFSWWQVLSQHRTLGANALFIGLRNVGLAPQHMSLVKPKGGGLV